MSTFSEKIVQKYGTRNPNELLVKIMSDGVNGFQSDQLYGFVNQLILVEGADNLDEAALAVPSFEILSGIVISHMIYRGARNFNGIALKWAKLGNTNIVRNMLMYGADNYDELMPEVIKNCHHDLIKELVRPQDELCDRRKNFLHSLPSKVRRDIPETLPMFGATKIGEALVLAGEYGNYNAMRYLETDKRSASYKDAALNAASKGSSLGHVQIVNYLKH